MNSSTSFKMNNEIARFLSKHGGLPVIKNVDEKILKAETRLGNKLVRLQTGVEAQFIKALRDKGYLPSKRSDQMGLISKILEVPFNDMREVMAEEGVKGAEIGRQLAFDELIKEGFNIQMKSFNEKVKERLQEKLYQFSADTFLRIEGDFIETLTTAYEDGAGIDEAITRLRDDFKGLRDHRLRTIARTEIQGAQNEGSNETMKEYGADYKQWLTVGDDRVRGNQPQDEYDHISLHGQVVRIDEPFSNGLMFPGDRDGDMGDWINCRCRSRPYIPRKDEKILTTPHYP